MNKNVCMLLLAASAFPGFCAYAQEMAPLDGGVITLLDQQGRAITAPLSQTGGISQVGQSSISSACTTYSNFGIYGNIIANTYYQWGAAFSFKCTGTPSAHFNSGSANIYLQQSTASGWVTVAGPTTWLSLQVPPGTYRWVVYSYSNQYLNMAVQEPVY